MERDFGIGDTVLCTESGVVGVVLRFYYPTSCEEQTKVLTGDGRKYHAPTYTWVKYDVEPLCGTIRDQAYSTRNTGDNSVIHIPSGPKIDVNMDAARFVAELVDSSVRQLIKRGICNE